MTLPTFDPGFSTVAMTAVWRPTASIAAMCRVEAALAIGSASAGVVPQAVAQRIEAACTRPPSGATDLLAQAWERGTPLLPLLDRLRMDLDDEAGRWLHHGATTQDIVDTATILQLRHALRLVREDLASSARHLCELADGHRHTGAPAWTLLQPAGTTTLGRRVAGWLSPVVHDLRAIREAQASLHLQLGGPIGTLDAFGPRADDVVQAVAAELGLVAPDLPWHTDRSHLTAVVTTAERAGRTIARIATDLVLLAGDGLVTMRAGSSSSIPGKRNPIDAVHAIAAAEACSGLATIMTRSRSHELERAAGSWHAERYAVPMVLHTAAAAAAALRRALATLDVQAPSQDHQGQASPASEAAIDRVVAACGEELER